MLCPNCNSTMTCLFVSYVCDRCNPPASSTLPNKAKTNNTVDTDYKIGYFLVRIGDPAAIELGCTATVFECEQDVWKYYSKSVRTVNKNTFRAEKIKVNHNFVWERAIIVTNYQYSDGFGAIIFE